MFCKHVVARLLGAIHLIEILISAHNVLCPIPKTPAHNNQSHNSLFNSFPLLKYAPHPEEDDDNEENGLFSDDLSDFDEDLEDEEYDEVYDLDGELELHPQEEDDEEAERGSGLLHTDDYDLIRERWAVFNFTGF